MAIQSYKPEIESITIVVLGNFNPSIFQPFWFAEHNLIRKAEAEEAELQTINKQVSIFSTSWFGLQVVRDRFSVSVSDASAYLPLKDLVLGTFQILRHTPISAVGLNSELHFPMNSEEDWHKFGNYFAPKESWRKVLQDPGTLSLMIQGKRENCLADKVHITIGPSIRVKLGVFFDINQHYDIASGDDKRSENSTDQLLEIVSEEWSSFMNYRESVPQKLFTDFDK